MQFEFATATRIVFGAGKLREIGSIARSFGKNPLVVTGSNTGRAELLLSLLREAGLQPALFSVSKEPTIATINAGLDAVSRAGSDSVIGFGGGSALDAGKAIAILMKNPGHVLDYLEVIGRGMVLSEPSLPFVAVPTTAGTGAEVTRNAVIGSPEHRAKASLRSPFMLPKVALVDPELTLQLPPVITAASGMDALTQLIEPFVSIRANPLTDSLCREAIPRVARSLRKAFADGNDLGAREDMSLASLFGGLALSNAGLGAVHGFANPIGGMFDAPHGAICAALLPFVTEANLAALRRRAPESRTEARYREVARMLTGNPKAEANDAVTWIRDLVSALEVPSLKTFGVNEGEFDEIIAKAQKASSMKGNPVELSAEELRAVLLHAL